jgi:hypothetical protein
MCFYPEQSHTQYSQYILVGLVIVIVNRELVGCSEMAGPFWSIRAAFEGYRGLSFVTAGSTEAYGLIENEKGARAQRLAIHSCLHIYIYIYIL